MIRSLSLPVVAGLIAAALCAAPASAAAQEARRGATVSQEEYEGWRQYSVHCARCHGQDVLGNPVAANLLESTKRAGPTGDKEVFIQVVRNGRPARGMPAFAEHMTAAQIAAVYAYVHGRAEGRIPAGRPRRPASN